MCESAAPACSIIIRDRQERREGGHFIRDFFVVAIFGIIFGYFRAGEAGGRALYQTLFCCYFWAIFGIFLAIFRQERREGGHFIRDILLLLFLGHFWDILLFF